MLVCLHKSLTDSESLLIVCRFPSVQVGASQEYESLDDSEHSILVQYLENKDKELWTRTNVIALAILVEHIVIGVKIVIALVIPDVPHKVV